MYYPLGIIIVETHHFSPSLESSNLVKAKIRPMDSDESRDLSSASDSESDGEMQSRSRQRSQSDSPSTRGRSNSSFSDSETEKQNVNKPKSDSSSTSRSSRSRSVSVDSKTNKSSQNSTPQHPESRSESVSSLKSPHSRAGSKSPENKSPISRSASMSPISRPTSTGSKLVHSSKSLDQPNRYAALSFSSENRNIRVKSPQTSGDRNRPPIIREGTPKSPSIDSTRSNSSTINHNDLEQYPHSPVNGRSKSISPDRRSRESSKSDSSRTSKIIHEAANLDDGITSDSSDSSEDNISRHRKGIVNADTRPEDISDDADSDIERKEREEKERERDAIQKESVANLQMAHEDLSDVSDLDAPSDDDESRKSIAADTKVKECLIEAEVKKVVESNARPDEGEEQLDFEAEDGECAEPETPKDKEDSNNVTTEVEKREATDVRESEKVVKEKELEEGELTDEDEARPEETEPRPVCRFFSRGQCTWGASCRFLHPGVTDKGNYTMFELIRPIVPGEFGHERMFYGRPEPPPMESAWERGLRTAKEMLRKSMKRKEQDIDFEEKKMNLSLTQEELDKENGYYTRGPSPEPRYAPSRHVVPVDYTPAPAVRPQPEEYYARRQVIYEPEYAPPPRERTRPYREMPAHRVPDYYPTAKYEEDPSSSTKLRKPKREVIVQRVEEDRRPARGDEWSDPWMRSKSPAGRKGRRRSYSSGSSYSSSSTSRSSSGSSRSSYRSKSSRRRQTSLRRHKRQVSPSVIVSERKAANERAALMNPPAPRKKAPSPGMMRAGAQNPPAPSMKVDQFGRTRSKLAVAAALARVKGRTRASRSRSSSGSSSASSSSESDSSGSSSSSSRERSPPRRPTGVDLAMALKAKAIDALKSGTEKRQIKLNLKTAPSITKKTDLSELAIHHQQQQGKKRSATSMASPPISSGLDTSLKVANKKASSRREELLKQLKAVEDAIAKKRSKVN
ncbi:zinc finger CCCH domain-containing protein 18 isoform X2 [Agrilus planipennis]|uniref:Zinc finger CCCH domain-containing protein 18 isoform X2 n=1 Tax=Agrilus planipennis TaxID=224129 RepID=A0A1W4WZ33_AGRPL|nr:zinc finger CCCH domain-containing protein 18 isoform X2 [Agrilus planipennis]